MIEYFGQELNVFKATSSIIAIGIFFDSLYILINNRLYTSDKGIFPFKFQKNFQRKGFLKIIYKKFNFLFEYRVFLTCMLLRLVIALLLIFGITNHYTLYILLFTFQLIFNLRNIFTLSGADQMQNIILFGLLVLSLDISEQINMLTLGYLTIQTLLSYFFTGFHKIKSKVWRNGNALVLITNSETFGNKHVCDFLYKNKKISLISCWLIILFQILFPFIVIFNINYVIAYLFIGICFHFMIAFFMNLNHFFWVYTSTYPILFFTLNYIL